jgi:hypothetical protein
MSIFPLYVMRFPSFALHRSSRGTNGRAPQGRRGETAGARVGPKNGLKALLLPEPPSPVTNR